MPKRSSLLLALLCFTSVASLLLIGNRELLFRTPVHEFSDFAVNALQIERAKQFEELYGNYSRFQFHHPGPAFFYVYAAAERVFLDGLGLVPSPYNAHLLGGILLQVGFFTLALALLRDVLGTRAILPLGLAIGAFHFAAARDVFVSIWPPHVLLMPFLAFFAGSVAVATGRLQRLPWVVLSGSFLVHGHVVQPLFVVVLFVASYAVGALTLHRTGPGWRSAVRRHWCAHALSAGVLLVFVTPLAIDLTRGADSNAATILRHVRLSVADDKSVLQSLVYFLSFIGYTRGPETLVDQIDGQTFALFSTRPLLTLTWLAALAVVLLGYARQRRQREPAAQGYRTLVAGWCGAVALCVVWGLKQTGPMFAYNGHFYYALHFLVYLLAAVVIIQWIPRRWCAAALALLLLLAAWIIGTRLKHETSYADPIGRTIQQATLAALAVDPDPDRAKLLVFERDDWSVAASMALALRRAGSDFRTGPLWRFMFQDHAVLQESELVDPPLPYSIWRLVRQPRVEPAVPITRSVHVVFQPAALAPADGRIGFRRDGDFTHYHVTGISSPDFTEGAWTNSPHVILQFRPEPATEAVHLQIVAVPFLIRDLIDLQPTELWFNEHRVFSAPFAGPGVLRADIPPEIWNEHPVAVLRMHVPNANAPAALGLWGDPRHLGLILEELTTRPVTAVPR